MRRATIALLMLTALSACGSKTDTRLKAIEDRLSTLEQADRAHDAITLKPGATGYGMLQSDVGRIAVAIADVQPFASGSRVTLDFGNPSSARLTGMKAKIEWGANDSKGQPMAGNIQSLDFVAPEPLPAGSWHQYVVDLAGVAPTNLGWIRVSAFNNGTVDLLSQ